ncbi:class I SAM-dependent methyltransferase [Arhodomonas sp. SL1]|uniref:class I SAM-dependent methyltransferase n=1 Tax=Arhodomonas sp. SL1 TaxID=3425691 RepID=UPI003F8806B7
MKKDKVAVREFWNEASCGEALYLSGEVSQAYREQANIRYKLEPYIPDFAGFARTHGLKVLEVGVGLGADHQRFAEAGADLYGLDLTPRAIEHTQRRVAAFGLSSHLSVGDVENLDFPDNYFDQVYSWGVLHHSPNTSKAIGEVKRVLKPGGSARVMIYHKWSLVGLMLWTRYALLTLRPWRTLNYIYARHMESPGTKAYSRLEAQELFSGFSAVSIETVLTHGDLLESHAGQRHEGMALAIARKLWPRRFIRAALPRSGLFMLIKARK